jgi:putative PIG3 family NAD(P)H quinone oxidoreductase
MRAIIITGTGGPEVLEIREVPTPEPRGDQVRVRVRACGVNRADLLQCKGVYPAPPGAPADIPGLEYAGEVDALGPDVVGPLKVGDRVLGIVGGGGQAEYVVTHERLAALIPSNLDFVEAAAVPEAFITAHDALVTQGRVLPGERVLIHAVGSGVGTAAVQIAHAMGCEVWGTSRTADKLEKTKPLGLDHGIEASQGDFAEKVRASTGGRGVDVVIDLLGGPALEGNMAALAPKGRLVLVGLLGGSQAPLDLNVMLRKRLTIVGTTLRARSLEEKIAVTQRFAAQVVPWLERSLVRPMVDSVFPFEDVRAGFLRLESNQVFGKVVLRIDERHAPQSKVDGSLTGVR